MAVSVHTKMVHALDAWAVWQPSTLHDDPAVSPSCRCCGISIYNELPPLLSGLLRTPGQPCVRQSPQPPPLQLPKLLLPLLTLLLLLPLPSCLSVPFCQVFVLRLHCPIFHPVLFLQHSAFCHLSCLSCTLPQANQASAVEPQAVKLAHGLLVELLGERGVRLRPPSHAGQVVTRLTCCCSE